MLHRGVRTFYFLRLRHFADHAKYSLIKRRDAEGDITCVDLIGTGNNSSKALESEIIIGGIEQDKCQQCASQNPEKSLCRDLLFHSTLALLYSNNMEV